jgi:hypothetical protein
VIAEDGNLYPYPRQHSSLLLAAGKTLDALLVPPSAGNYPIFDRRLYRSNDPTVQGTMFTFVTATAAPPPALAIAAEPEAAIAPAKKGKKK